jgi:hypothetical protein
MTPETPDVLGWSWNRSILIECKTSRADFLADAKKHFRRFPEMGMGQLRYYLAPRGLLTVDDMPARWGLIEAENDGSTRVLRASEAFETDARQEVAVLLSLLRRLRVEPGKRCKIRVYMQDGESEPRATATIAAVSP